MSTPRHDRTDPHNDGLAVYLRDHYAGSAAGLALLRRCRRAHQGTTVDDVLAGMQAEIEADRRSLLEIMSSLGVSPSAFKAAVGRFTELVGRLKGNGRIVRRSPSSSVVELEALAAGVLTKANLWRSLRAAAAHHSALHGEELSRLIARADDQVERLVAVHDHAAGQAFAASSDRVTAGARGGESPFSPRAPYV